MSTTDVAGVSPEEYLSLSNELSQLMKDQAAGMLEPQKGETDEQWQTRTALRVKRGIEITSILRRSNTGPAAPRKRKAAKADLEGLAKNLLG